MTHSVAGSTVAVGSSMGERQLEQFFFLPLLFTVCDSVSVLFLFPHWDHGSVTVSWRINREDICWL